MVFSRWLWSALIALLLVAPLAQAESLPGGTLSKWPIDAADPVSSVPPPEALEAEPIQAGYFLMDLALTAEQATKRKDYQKAIGCYKAMQKMVPERAASYTKMCEAYEAMGDRVQALESCKQAVNHEGTTVNDAGHYVRILTSGNPSSADLKEANAVLAHLKTQNVDPLQLGLIECEAAVQLGDEAKLAACTTALQAKAPDDQRVISYAWALAIKQRDYSRAKELVVRARGQGMPPEALEKMVEGTRAIRYGWFTQPHVMFLGALLIAALGGAVMLLARRARPQGNAALV